MNLAAIRDGLETRLATVSGLRAHDTVPDTLVPPAAVVVPERVDYHVAMRKGLCAVRFRVQVVAQRVAERSGQDLLDGYLSAGTGLTSSLVDAIEADRTLGGAASDVVVEAASAYGPVTYGGVDYLGAELAVVVYTPRT